ncbi:MAG: NAD-dependent succinate-semialdehyde dehydrogenase [Gammaproteobacteria bacterium]|nr:NAD-dependent succinate-semialdehyde dehydrogenase [Gammaproteobacteria bacterium]MBU1653246.1 NAD-dependent succinate-semialdehyde dehydrogenase [Gammaproteobacteria bacterium]MBU1961050.1 NAD-dependent succinate-semialdehyde dehydrogenase [Gammaproteobacteria bacterium]
MVLTDEKLFKSQAHIAGKWVDAASGAVYPVTNPADGGLLGHVPDMDGEDAQRAVAAAESALPRWRSMTAAERAGLLMLWYQSILDHTEDLARIMTLEQGKPLSEARGEVKYGAAFLQWFAEEGKRVYGDIIPSPANDRRILAIKQPIGVAALITPWNFPLAMLTRKAGAALAAGCTVVAKPAEDTPLTALAFAELGQRVGIPAGVFNIITTRNPAPVGYAFTQSSAVRKLSFTGSTEVGKRLMADCAATVKRISLELGGNAPFIVFDDADLDEAVAGALASKYRNSGQTCICANRFLIQDGVYDAFAERLTAAVKRLRVGPGMEDSGQGPLINQAAIDKVDSLVADAIAKGARALCGGNRHALGGTFYEPTVLTDVNEGMACVQQEIFGPVAPLMRFHEEAEAVQLANDTAFGLAAYFYARDIGRIWRVSEALEYGMVGVNQGVISTEVAPFGGIKESGLGREGSKYGIDEYLEIKYLCMGGL